MKSPPEPAHSPKLERSFFFILLALLTVAFAAVLWPFYGAVFWGSVLALMFQPLYRRFLAPDARPAEPGGAGDARRSSC